MKSYFPIAFHTVSRVNFQSIWIMRRPMCPRIYMVGIFIIHTHTHTHTHTHSDTLGCTRLEAVLTQRCHIANNSSLSERSVYYSGEDIIHQLNGFIQLLEFDWFQAKPSQAKFRPSECSRWWLRLRWPLLILLLFYFFLIFFFVFKLCSSTSMNPIRQFGQFSAGFSRIQPDSAGFSGIPATKGRPCLAWTIQKPIEGFLKDSGDTFALFKLILTTSKEIGGSLRDLWGILEILEQFLTRLWPFRRKLKDSWEILEILQTDFDHFKGNWRILAGFLRYLSSF